MKPFLLGFSLSLLFCFLAQQAFYISLYSIPSFSRSPPPPRHAIQNTSIPSSRPPRHRILCWIPFLFSPKNTTLYTSDQLISRITLTYASYCDKFYFVTQHGNEHHPTGKFIAHHYERLTSKDLWNQVSRAWFEIGTRHLLDFDFFIKLDIDSFLIPGNLRYHVSQWDPDSIHYFGHTVFEQSRNVKDPRAQFNVGAGYGVSRGLLKSLLPYLVRNYSTPGVLPEEKCVDAIRWGEDVKFGDCVRVVHPHLFPDNSKDRHFRDRFLPFEPSQHMMVMRLNSEKFHWFWRGKNLNQTTAMLQCCSTRPVLFHHFKLSRQFWFVDYFIHRVAVDPLFI